MYTSLLPNKFHFPPTRAIPAQRPQLVERLQTGLQGTLTLISAPVGSWKMTILASWRAGPRSRVPAAWNSLDSAENDLAHSLIILTSSFDTLQPGLTGQIQSLLQASETPDNEAVLTLPIKRLRRFARDFIPALKDYHLIETAPIHTALDFLLEYLLPKMQHVLLTLSDPALARACYLRHFCRILHGDNHPKIFGRCFHP